MNRKKITIRGVDLDAVELLNQIRLDERRVLGAIVSDAIRIYWELPIEEHYDKETELY